MRKPAKNILFGISLLSLTAFNGMALGQSEDIQGDDTQTEINAGVMAAVCNDAYSAQACADMRAKQAQAETASINIARAQHAVTAKPLAATDQAAAKERIRRELRDPDSAEFRNLAAYHDVRSGDEICGEVNAKNGYGGYVGYSAFILRRSADGDWTVELDETDPAHLVARTCRMNAAEAAP